MTNDSRKYQLQGSYTRYYDGNHAGFDSENSPSKRRNFKTFESAMKAAKKEFKNNELPAIVKREAKYDKRGRLIEAHNYAKDGRELSWSEDKPQYWHVDGVRIVDRITQKVLWES